MAHRTGKAAASCTNPSDESIGENLRRMPEAEDSDLNQLKDMIITICK